MNEERIDGLMAYLNTLSRLNEDSYRCTDEIAEAIAEIRRELEIGVEKPKKAVAGRTEFFYEKYIDEIKRIAHDYRPFPINEEMFRAYVESMPIKTIWADRCSGSSTSAIALSNVVPRVAYIIEHPTIAKDCTTRLGAKNVFSIADIRRGGKLLRDYDVFIFDEVSDRNVLIEPLQIVRDTKGRIIKIRSSDYSAKSDLSNVSTAQLTDELAKRYGVTEHVIGVEDSVLLEFSDGYNYVDGPARIIVNKD